MRPERIWTNGWMGGNLCGSCLTEADPSGINSNNPASTCFSCYWRGRTKTTTRRWRRRVSIFPERFSFARASHTRTWLGSPNFHPPSPHAHLAHFLLVLLATHSSKPTPHPRPCRQDIVIDAARASRAGEVSIHAKAAYFWEHLALDMRTGAA